MPASMTGPHRPEDAPGDGLRELGLLPKSIQGRQGLASPEQYPLALRSEAEKPPIAAHDGNAEFPLEFAHSRRQRGLGDIATLGGLPEVPVLR